MIISQRYTDHIPKSKWGYMASGMEFAIGFCFLGLFGALDQVWGIFRLRGVPTIQGRSQKTPLSCLPDIFTGSCCVNSEN